MMDGTEPVDTSPPLEEQTTPETQTNPEPEAETLEEEGSEEENGDSQEELTDKPKKGKSAHARIDELTRKFRSTERELEYYKRLATGSALPSAAEAAPKPDRSLYVSDDDYLEALTDWKVEQKLQSSQRETANQAAQGLKATTWEARMEETRASIQDFDEVVANSEIPVAQHVAEALMESAKGPDLAYHMAKNPAIVDQLNRMSPLQAAMELAKLEVSLAKAPEPKPKPMTKAPPPANPISAVSSHETDLSRLPMDQYIEARKKQGANWASRY